MKKYSLKRTLFIVFLVIVAIANVIYFVTTLFTRPPHIIYPEFGIEMPPGYSLHGIDVSRHQNVINWSDVKEMQVKDIKIGFVFIKATEGMGKIDEDFRRNWLQAKEEEIPKGAYHYFIAGKSGRAQAQNFLDIVKLEKGDLPPVLDIEQANGVEVNNVRAEVKTWLNKIEQHYKTKPIIYTSNRFF